MFCCCRCAGSPVFKTRLMAARAIQPLVSRDHLKDVLKQLLSHAIDSTCVHNFTHGILLQVNLAYSEIRLIIPITYQFYLILFKLPFVF